MRAWFTSDLHIGHRNIGKFREIPEEFLEAAEGDGTLANTLWIQDFCKKNVTKRDVIYCLGDNIFTRDGLADIACLPGRKIAYGGNHDDLHVDEYRKVFSDVRGCSRHKSGFWLSHFPVHEAELRGRFSVHGHVHYQSIPDYRYINVCCDNLQKNIGQPMITIEDLKATIDLRKETEGLDFYANNSRSTPELG